MTTRLHHLAFSVLFLMLLGRGAALAETYTVSSVTQANLGNIVSAATGDTIYTAAAGTGAVTKTGTGVRLSTGIVRGLITISCSNVTTGGSGSCATNRQFDVRITVGAASGRTKAFTSFSAAVGTPTTALVSGPTLSGTTLTFRAGGMAAGATRTFHVGFVVPTGADNSGLASGSAVANYTVQVKNSAAATYAAGLNGSLIASVFRPIAMAKTSDLSFGRVVRPPSGGATISIAAATGARTTTAGGLVSTPTPSRAAFTITGEGAQTVSIAVPTSFSMTSGANTLTVTTATNAAGAPALSGALGASGTYSFGVGGSVAITSATPPAAYTGSFSVTAQYN